jgi:DNA/RNA-binding domain of Phe-tRNA-synthetase-like protein
VYFRHSSDIWRDFPELVPGVVLAQGITRDVSVSERAEPFLTIARQRLSSATESELPEIRAWRRAFSRMGLKPTQFRCASESLLRRFRKEGALPQLHPLIDLCNAMSLAFAVPIAVIDVDRISEGIEVHYADGDEDYLTFAGEHEQPEPGEVIFADEARRAHARRWTNRQSGLSAVTEQTANVLIVAVSGEIETIWGITTRSAVLTSKSSLFEF